MVRRTKKHGYFISFEGIDGCGKTTQLKRATAYLKERGLEVAVFREPGSTPLAEKIRKLLLDPRSRLTDVGELLLYETARNDLVTHEIAPALESGKVVLCDRFYDSTTAYQGYGRKLGLNLVRQLHEIAIAGCRPDLTFLFDVDLKTSLARLKGKADRLESQSSAFFRRVRKGFLEIARTEPKRVTVIDGRNNSDQVFAEVRTILDRKLKTG